MSSSNLDEIPNPENESELKESNNNEDNTIDKGHISQSNIEVSNVGDDNEVNQTVQSNEDSTMDDIDETNIGDETGDRGELTEDEFHEKFEEPVQSQSVVVDNIHEKEDGVVEPLEHVSVIEEESEMTGIGEEEVGYEKDEHFGSIPEDQEFTSDALVQSESESVYEKSEDAKSEDSRSRKDSIHNEIPQPEDKAKDVSAISLEQADIDNVPSVETIRFKSTDPCEYNLFYRDQIKIKLNKVSNTSLKEEDSDRVSTFSPEDDHSISAPYYSSSSDSWLDDFVDKDKLCWPELEKVEPLEDTGRKLTFIFLDLKCRKNHDRSKHLILRGNQLINNLKRRLRDDDLKLICEYLEKHQLVKSVDLSYNLISSTGVQDYLVPFLKINTSVKELLLSFNEITLEGLESFAKISSDLSLLTLRLNGNKLGPKSGEALAKLLEKTKTLKHLDISETDQTVSSLACVAAILRNDYIPSPITRNKFERYPQQEENIVKKPVKCSPSRLGSYIKYLVAKEKAEDVMSSVSLSETELEIINCPCPETIDWTQPFKRKPSYPESEFSSEIESITTLKDEEDFKCKCIELISKTTSVTSEESNSKRATDNTLLQPTLQILFLDRILGHYHYQPLTYHFARILSDMLKNNNSLIELHLEKNSLNDIDIEILCSGLKDNKTLKLLDLSANRIGCIGLSNISQCIPETGIEALILNHNGISDYGARCLFFTLASTKLKMLDLAHNSISDIGMMDMLYTMRKQIKILVLFIWGNPITHVSLKKIHEYLIEGWLQTDSLDIKIYEVDGVLQHALRSCSNPYKDNYYVKERPDDSIKQRPSQSIGDPLSFQHYNTVYEMIMSKYLNKNYVYPPMNSNTCTT